MKIMNRLVMTLAGGFLIVAGLLKANQIYTTPVPSDGFWESWLFFVIQVPLEIGLGVWLVSGLFRKAAWLLGTLAYFGFIFITGYKFAIGAESCGCFGAIEVPPVITLIAIDIPFFVLLAIFRPRGEKLLPPPWPHGLHVLVVSVPACLFIGALTAMLYVHGEVPVPDLDDLWGPKYTDNGETGNGTKPVKDHEAGTGKETVKDSETETGKETVKDSEAETGKETVKDSETETGKETVKDSETETGKETVKDSETETGKETVKDSETETGKETVKDSETETDKKPKVAEKVMKRWPWLEYADISDKIDDGMVIVMCYRHDCDVCHEAIPEYLQMAIDLGVGIDEDDIKMAFLEIPPYGSGDEFEFPEDTKCLLGKLAEDKDEYNDKPSPIVVTMIDGEVYKAWQGEAPDMMAIMESFE